MMEISQLEGFDGRVHLENLSTRRLLASLHRGDAFTKVFSLALYVLVWVMALVFGLVWVGSWGHVYQEFERWQLVLAFVDQFFLLCFLCVLLYVSFLRAGHLRQIKPGHFVSLQATALMLRWLGECVLILTIGALGHAFLGVPEAGWISTLFGASGSSAEADVELSLKAWSLVAMGWVQIVGFLVFTCFYASANVIEVFLAIERNTRDGEPAGLVIREVTGRGHEVRAHQANTMALP